MKYYTKIKQNMLKIDIRKITKVMKEMKKVSMGDSPCLWTRDSKCQDASFPNLWSQFNESTVLTGISASYFVDINIF